MSDETQTEVPEDKVAFNQVLKKFRIGVKGDFYETITDDIATTGGELVFETPELLMKKLGEWHSHIDPPTRRRVIEYWFAKKGTPVPEEIIRVAGMTETEKAKAEDKKTQEERQEAAESKKYTVDSETGAITVAKREDRPALDWEEAVKLSTRIKGEGDKGEKEPPFIADTEGNWQLNPKAKIGGMELLAFESVRKSQERGEPSDPFEVLKKRAEDIETMRLVFGGAGKEGGRFVDSVEDLLKLRNLLGADEDTKNILAGIYSMLKGGGAGKGESEEVKALRDELKGLTEELQRKDREAIAGELTGLRNKLSEVMGELQRVKQGEKSTNEYGIMSEMVKVVDRRLGAVESTVQGVFGKRPPPLAESERKKLTEAISEEALAEQEIDDLAEQAFYGRPPPESIAVVEGDT